MMQNNTQVTLICRIKKPNFVAKISKPSVETQQKRDNIPARGLAYPGSIGNYKKTASFGNIHNGGHST
jgi:hypothetical protein